MFRWFQSYYLAYTLLLSFWKKHIGFWFEKMPHELSPERIMQEMEKGNDFQVLIAEAPAKEYNADYEKLKVELSKCVGARYADFNTLVMLFFVIRCASIAAAFSGSLSLTIGIISIQFIFMPFTIFASLGLFLPYVPLLYVSHLFVHIVLQSIVPDAISYILMIDNRWIIVFLLLDQLICVAYSWATPGGGLSVKKSFRNYVFAVLWGFFNTKTYYLIVFPLLRGNSINITCWLIDALFQLVHKLTGYISTLGISGQLLFYNVHRMVHLPLVYEQSHKIHHYLPDATPFDAHLFGLGAPEEIGFLLVELLLGRVKIGSTNLLSASISSQIFRVGLFDKFIHTRKEVESEGNNEHANHHSYHIKNFGNYGMMIDMYYETCTNNTEISWGNYNVKKTICQGIVKFECTVSKFKLKSKDILFTE